MLDFHVNSSRGDMKVIDRRAKAKDAVINWHSIYDSKPNDVHWKRCHEKTKQLDALGPSPDPDDVDRIIGNTSWTNIPCVNCHRNVYVAVQMRPDDPELGPIFMCKDCVNEAREALISISQNEDEGWGGPFGH